ncbi:putative membrane protein [Bacillus pseudomycoides]|nr:putative membrane protein [Bacillus pseudomycoides]
MPEFYKRQRFLYPVYVLAFFMLVLITILGYLHWIMGMAAFFIFLYCSLFCNSI